MKKHKGEMEMVMHQDAVSLHKVGSMSDEEMRYFDEVCFVQPAAAVPRVFTQKPAAAARSGVPTYAHGK